MEEIKIVGQGLIAILLGGILGWEREAAGKWAGIRTHMLVCLGAFIFVKTGELMIRDTLAVHASDMIRADPVRILEAIVTGVSFIGAGTVFRDSSRNIARGLTTAATLLVVAPIGVAVALDKYVLASGLTIVVLIVLRCVLWFEKRVVHRSEPAENHS